MNWQIKVWQTTPQRPEGWLLLERITQTGWQDWGKSGQQVSVGILEKQKTSPKAGFSK
ncbi:TPA: hypothetical protein K8E21_004413 [Enterobacter cancerogenus]|nr:hypothetical protein [Enterobacter cancerogenus]